MNDQQLLGSFRHEANGDWTCVKPILFDGPARNVAVMPGTTIKQTDYILGMKIARGLDEAEARSHPPVKLRSLIHH